MIIITQYEVYDTVSRIFRKKFKEILYSVKRIKILKRSELVCPRCGGELKSRGTCLRKERLIDDECYWRLPVMQCRSCGAYHRVLPDRLLPYKRYGADSYWKIYERSSAESDEGDYDERTYWRVKFWMDSIWEKEPILLAKAKAEEYNIDALVPGKITFEKLKYIVRLENLLNLTSSIVLPCLSV